MKGQGTLYIGPAPRLGVGYVQHNLQRSQQEQPSLPGTGLRFLSLKRGLTCIIFPASPSLRTDLHSSNTTPISIVRIISTTIGAHLGAELISNRRDGILFVFLVDLRSSTRPRRDVFLRVVGLRGR